MNKILYSSESTEWATPQWFYDWLDSNYNFDLDAAASVDNHKHSTYFDKDTNSLLQYWTRFRSIFLNPPYGKDIATWCHKALNTAQISDTRVVMLLPARTDTRWFHYYCTKADMIIYLKGRIKFERTFIYEELRTEDEQMVTDEVVYRVNDLKADSPTFPSIVVVFDICKTHNVSYVDLKEIRRNEDERLCSNSLG